MAQNYGRTSSINKDTMRSASTPSASAWKFTRMRWRRTGGATARTSSSDTTGRPCSTALALPASSNDWKKLALGYVYNLSKRTAMYASYARVDNDGAQTKSVANNGLSAGAASPGGNSTGYELGIRHSF